MLRIKCCTEFRAHVEIHIHGEITSGGCTATGENHVHKNKNLMCFSILKALNLGGKPWILQPNTHPQQQSNCSALFFPFFFFFRCLCVHVALTSLFSHKRGHKPVAHPSGEHF